MGKKSVADAECQPVCDANTTPLIDVMLVLLIMFILTIPVMTHAVKLDLPHSPPAERQPTPEVLDLEIDFDGAVYWNGSRVPSMQALDHYFRSESHKDPQAEIHLRPDRRAKYDVVARVLASAQRNHMKRIGFVNTAEYRD
jgi:biopolymer transport protein ExbD